MKKCFKNLPFKTIQEILFKNPRYIFFRVSSSGSAITGDMKIELRPFQSIAMDPSIAPRGAPVFLIGHDKQKTIPFNIAFVMDRGNAIKGHGRLDIYTGSGSQAEEIAMKFRSQGRIIFLIAK